MNKNNSLRYFFVVGILTLFIFINSYSQPVDNQISKVVLGEEYQAGWLHELLFGKQWRDLWTNPIEFPQIELNTLNGGLIALKSEVTNHTKSLILSSNETQLWKFTPINKDAFTLIPDVMHKTFVDDIIKDQISSINLFTRIMYAELMKAVGIQLNTPVFILMPDDISLGEFRNEFANRIGTIELINPDKVNYKNTEELFYSLENDRITKIDSKEFLKIRLMDILLGNWNRNINKWKWEKVTKQNYDCWIPRPDNSEQAFSKFDGLLPFAASFIFPQLTTFNENLASIGNYTQSGRYIDRRFLTELSKNQWDSIAVYIHNSLTDEVIENAVNKMPSQINQSLKEEIFVALKSRIIDLSDLCDDYYKLINQVADVFASNKNDYAIVNRLNNEQTSVELFSITENNSILEQPYFSKIFNNSITDEIRIYLLDGDDEVLVKGEVDESPLIRIIGGDGNDKFEDNSIVNGFFLSVTPFKKAEKKTRFYDSDDNSKFVYSSSTKINTEGFDDSELLSDEYEQIQKDRGNSWGFLPEVGFSTTDGVLIGGMIDLFSYNFRKVPYEYLQSLRFLYAFLPKSYKVEYFGEFIKVFGSTDILLNIANTELSFTNYFGFGNENSFDRYLYRDKYYWLEQKVLFINPQLRYNFDENTNLSLGFFYEFNRSSLRNEELIESFPFNNYGIGKLQHAGVNFNFLFDTRENNYYSKEGKYIKINGSYYNELLDTRENFFRAEYDVRNYITLDIPFETTLAIRSTGGKVWGKFPFYHAMFVGGEDNLRGYTRKRFSGNTSISFQSEIRTKIMENKILFNGDLGIHLFAETGRVFSSNQDSDKWHPSFGGGIWANFIDRMFVFSLTYAYAPDEQNIYFDTRMVF